MNSELDHHLTKQHVVPLDEARDIRLQAHYQANMFRTLQSLKRLVKQAHLSKDEEYHLLYGIAYIETHIENQTQDIEVSSVARWN